MKSTQDKTILVVDDQPGNLKIIYDIFESSNLSYNIMVATNAVDALKAIDYKQPDLVITDWDMPGISGIEFIRLIKQKPYLSDIPVIMCTGVMTTSEHLKEALEAGAVDYIKKPIDGVELISRTNASLHLSEKYQQIKELNESKDKIFSIISHDLRSPVGNIKAFIDVILNYGESYSNEKLLEMIGEVGKRIANTYNVLENLLQWANSHHDNIEFKPKDQLLNNAIDENIELLSNECKLKNISVDNQASTYLHVLIDKVLISVVLRNLLSNAIKFTPEGGNITITAKRYNKEICVSVSDSGVGIDSERIPHIFDKFNYETTYGTNNEKGSGLGLKLSAEFVKKHGGKIWVESTPDKGSTFSFTVPVSIHK